MRFLRENHLLLDDTGPVSECEEDNSLNADDDADSQTVGGLDSSILDPVEESGKIPLLSSHSSRVDFHGLFSVFPSCTSVPPEEIESPSVIEETEDTSVCADAVPPEPGQIMPQPVHIDSLPPLSGASLDPASESGGLGFAEEESAMIAYCTDAVCCFIERFLHLLLEDPVTCRRKLLVGYFVDFFVCVCVCILLVHSHSTSSLLICIGEMVSILYPCLFDRSLLYVIMNRRQKIA